MTRIVLHKLSGFYLPEQFGSVTTYAVVMDLHNLNLAFRTKLANSHKLATLLPFPVSPYYKPSTSPGNPPAITLSLLT